MVLMNIQASSPILLFDSGVGGLSVFAELNRLLPNAPVIYAADLAGLPYGTKTEPQIAARVTGLLGRMAERYKPRLICIACNTASTIALEMVRDVLEVPIVGTVPAIKPAASFTQTGVIGLLGTEATIRQHYVDNLEAQFASDKTLLRLAAPDLVGAAEGKLRGLPVDMAVVDACRTWLAIKRSTLLYLPVRTFRCLEPSFTRSLERRSTCFTVQAVLRARLQGLSRGRLLIVPQAAGR